jgi:tetratricopeptide (TPR) repeat protein
LIILLNIAVLAVVAFGTWWLTGMDKTAAGESKRDHHLTRALRCVAVVFLSAIFLGTLEQASLGYGGIPILIIVPLSIGLTLRSSLAEFFTHGFLGLLDPALHDHRELDPNQARRYQDAIAHLIHHGHRDEAIKLCEELKQSGEVDLGTLESTLEFLGVKPERAPANPLVEAARLRTQADFAGAEQRLKSLLLKNPADASAAIMLMRLYAQDLRQPSRAHAVLRALEKQPQVPASHVEFARRSIEEWSRPQPVAPEMAVPPEPVSLDNLLARGSLGLAVEMLEDQLKTQPDDFELQLKLAEVHAVHCKNVSRAEKIIGRLERAAKHSPEQIVLARSKLAEWRALAEKISIHAS